MAVVVDTDVVSYIFKGDTRGELYKPHLVNQFPILSFMTVAELEDWTLQSNWGARRKNELETYLRSYSIKHSSVELCKIWGATKNHSRRTGINISTNDAWIAATALIYQVPLVTHNALDFQAVPQLQIISEVSP